MKAPLHPDPKLLLRAQDLSGIKNRKDLLNAALKALIERELAKRSSPGDSLRSALKRRLNKTA